MQQYFRLVALCSYYDEKNSEQGEAGNGGKLTSRLHGLSSRRSCSLTFGKNMKSLALILFLFVTCNSYAQEISGIGAAPMQPQELTDELSFSVISQAPANTLHWKITRNKKIISQGPDSKTAGDEVLPGERYAFYWDKDTRVFWFATIRAILKIDLSHWGSTTSVSRSTNMYESYKDLPLVFRANVDRISE